MADIAIGVLAIAGATLVVLAGVGVVRFDDVYARMHAATKASTLGIALIGAACAIALDSGWAKIALAVAFIFITAPAGAHFVGRIAYRAEGIDIDVDARDDLSARLNAPDDEPSGER